MLLFVLFVIDIIVVVVNVIVIVVTDQVSLISFKRIEVVANKVVANIDLQ